MTSSAFADKTSTSTYNSTHLKMSTTQTAINLQYTLDVTVLHLDHGYKVSVSMVFHKKQCSTRSKAFSWSSEIRPTLFPNELKIF